MAFNIGKYYKDLFTSLLSANTRLKVSKNFHKQVRQIDDVLKNDTSGMISTIVDFMVQSANVPIMFESKNSNLNKIFNSWKENVNSDVNIDIPRGFRSLSEQYFRERWKSSFIVLNIQWGKIDGYDMPINMWFSDGGAIYVEKEDSDLKATKYYLGQPKVKGSQELKSNLKRTVIIRKPYNFWYDKYPTPYLVKKGALYHSLFKQTIMDKQSQGINQVFPAMMAIKVGSDEAMRKNNMPTKEDLEDVKQKFVDLKTDTEDRTTNNGLIGAFPYDVNFENLLPEFSKILDEKITSGTDRNLLMSLGLIEFKGFSTNREESVLNPKPMVSEIEDGVEDFVELIDDVVYEIRKRNTNKTKFSAKDISIGHGPIKNLLTDAMKVLIRSLYDRGLVSKGDTVEGTTSFDFIQQVEKRKKETNDNLDEVMKAPVILNQNSDDYNTDNSDSNIEQTPAKKKSETDVSASDAYMVECPKCNKIFDYLSVNESGMGYIKCPNCNTNITQNNHISAKTKDLTVTQKQVFMNAYNRCLNSCEELDYDEEFKYATSLEFADTALQVYLEKTYKKNSELPDEIKAMDSKKQTLFRKTFNQSLKNGYTLVEALKEANKIMEK